VCNLLAIVHGSRLRARSFIASRYADAAVHFEETLAFAEELGWLRSENGSIEPTGHVTAPMLGSEGLQRSLAFAEALLASAGPYQRVLASYLSRFTRSRGELVYSPDLESRLLDSAVRDFLMDLGAVTHRPEGDFYVLEGPFAACALWARNVVGPSARELTRHAEERSALGLRTELAVLEWEKVRVGARYRDRIRHVSLENAAACFDIQSVTVNQDAEPRFIEVKAVALDSFEFHWSRAEIEAAEILADRYFLYLLPVLASDAFDLARMEIVQDAYSRVYRNPSTWSTTADDIVCRKRESSSS
jgi:hypothetical protein